MGKVIAMAPPSIDLESGAVEDVTVISMRRALAMADGRLLVVAVLRTARRFAAEDSEDGPEKAYSFRTPGWKYVESDVPPTGTATAKVRVKFGDKTLDGRQRKLMSAGSRRPQEVVGSVEFAAGATVATTVIDFSSSKDKPEGLGTVELFDARGEVGKAVVDEASLWMPEETKRLADEELAKYELVRVGPSAEEFVKWFEESDLPRRDDGKLYLLDGQRIGYAIKERPRVMDAWEAQTELISYILSKTDVVNVNQFMQAMLHSSIYLFCDFVQINTMINSSSDERDSPPSKFRETKKLFGQCYYAIEAQAVQEDGVCRAQISWAESR
jgi:hypothetical protein